MNRMHLSTKVLMIDGLCRSTWQGKDCILYRIHENLPWSYIKADDVVCAVFLKKDNRNDLTDDTLFDEELMDYAGLHGKERIVYYIVYKQNFPGLILRL